MTRLSTLRLGFKCTERWDDMVGDDRVRACAGCNRDVFNLTAMTRDEAEALLATRGVKPCVRFYRRPDGSVMTSDCPTRRDGRLAVVAAGAALAIAPAAHAEPPAAIEDKKVPVPEEAFMGEPLVHEEMGEIIETRHERPVLEWSIWGRLGVGTASRQPDVIARRLGPPTMESASTWEAAATADLSLGVAADGQLRVGAWGELRTSSGPVAGGELVIEGLPPHPYTSHLDGAGSVVVRAGGNAHVMTGAVGFGYVGSYAPWGGWVRHVVGARVVGSINRSRDDSREWSATVGLELEPIGVIQALTR